jgi:hypothetical protein
MIPNFIIPSEYEMLDALSKNAGVAVVWIVMLSHLFKIKLKIDRASKCHIRKFFIIGQNDNLTSFQEIEAEVKIVLMIISWNYYDQYIPKL